MTSKFLGGLVGVDKFAKIIMAKTMGWVRSVLDALSKIILDVALVVPPEPVTMPSTPGPAIRQHCFRA